MNPQHKAMLRAVVAGSITCHGEPLRFYFDGSPVERFTTKIIEELLHDELVQVAYGSVEPTDTGHRALS